MMDLESQELVSLVSLMFGAIEKVVFGNGSCDFECSKIPLINFQLMNLSSSRMELPLN